MKVYPSCVSTHLSFFLSFFFFFLNGNKAEPLVYFTNKPNRYINLINLIVINLLGGWMAYLRGKGWAYTRTSISIKHRV